MLQKGRNTTRRGAEYDWLQFQVAWPQHANYNLSLSKANVFKKHHNRRHLLLLRLPPVTHFSSLKITDRSLRYAINSLIHSVSLAMSWLTFSSTCQLISVIITTLIIHHSFTLSLQAQNLPFQQILPTLILLLRWTAFTITGPDRTYHASRFIFSSFFSFNFSVCSVWWTTLSTRQLFIAR